MSHVDREARMDKGEDYRKSVKNAHEHANQAAESSRQHTNDLDKIIRSAKGARDQLTDGQDRQRRREQNTASPTQRADASSRTAAHVRLRAIESQLTSAFNYLSTGQNALAVLGRVENARRSIETARHTADKVRTHVKEPNHVPGDSVAGINERLAELDRRISDVEARLAEATT